MYPLVVVLGVAAVENRPRVYRTALPLSLLGASVAAYHSWFQASAAAGVCTVRCCGAVQFRVLGLTIPNFSARLPIRDRRDGRAGFRLTTE